MAYRHRIVYIEDHLHMQKWFQAALLGGDPPFLRDIDVTFLSQPPDDIKELLAYDAVVVDYELKGPRTGAEVAQYLDPHRSIPVVMVTGMDLKNLPPGLWMFLDGLAWKDAHADTKSAHGLFAAMRVLMRQLGRIRAAYERGYADALAGRST